MWQIYSIAWYNHIIKHGLLTYAKWYSEYNLSLPNYALFFLQIGKNTAHWKKQKNIKKERFRSKVQVPLIKTIEIGLFLI